MPSLATELMTTGVAQLRASSTLFWRPAPIRRGFTETRACTSGSTMDGTKPTISTPSRPCKLRTRRPGSLPTTLRRTSGRERRMRGKMCCAKYNTASSLGWNERRPVKMRSDRSSPAAGANFRWSTPWGL